MIESNIISELIKHIFYAGIFYGIMGTLTIEGLIIVIYHLIGKRGE